MVKWSNVWRKASLAHHAPEKIERAARNYAEGRARWPEEWAKTAEAVERLGLGDHPEVIEHYSRGPHPIPVRSLTVMKMYPESHGVPFDRGEILEPIVREPQRQGGSHIASSWDDYNASLEPPSQAERIYRRPVKPTED